MSPTSDVTQARPRVEGDREAEILEAVMDVLADVGYDRFTMDAVATRAHVSKATLYRRWNGKVALAIDALLHQHAQEHRVPADTGSLREDLISAYCGTGGLTDKPTLSAFGAILTAVTRDEEFAAEFRGRVLAPKIAATTAVFERARDRGEIGDHVDIGLLAPAVAGIVLHRFLMLGEAPTRDTVIRVLDQIVLPAARAAG